VSRWHSPGLVLGPAQETLTFDPSKDPLLAHAITLTVAAASATESLSQPYAQQTSDLTSTPKSTATHVIELRDDDDDDDGDDHSKEPKPQLYAGAIVGIVVGIVAALVIVILMCYFFVKGDEDNTVDSATASVDIEMPEQEKDKELRGT
jgi:hypothetical protein